MFGMFEILLMQVILENDADVGEDKISKKARLEQLEPMEIVQKVYCGFP